MKYKNNKSKYKKIKSQMDENNPFGFFKWIIKTEMIIVSAILLLFLIYRMIPGKIIFKIKYSIKKRFISSTSINNNNFNLNDLLNSISQNKKISIDEKMFIEKFLKDEVQENINYIDIKNLNERLKSLKTIYNKEYYLDKNNKLKKLNPKYDELGIAGSYNAFFNKIEIYEQIEDYKILDNYSDEVFDFNNCNKEAYFHELNHFLSNTGINTDLNKSVFLESINELFTREYYYSINTEEVHDNNGYNHFIVLAYSMAELLPEDTIREYKFNSNESILIDGLLKIDDNMDEAYKLIVSANYLNVNNGKEDYLNENFKSFYEAYKYFYEKKYNNEIISNIDLLLYFYNSPIQTKDEKNAIYSYLNLKNEDEIIDVIPKGYYSKVYKEINNCVKVICRMDGQKKVIEIR